MGGWKYDSERDGPDFVGFTAEQCRELEETRGFDFSEHPAMISATTGAVDVAASDEIASNSQQ